MVKEKHFSVHHEFRTGILSKICFGIAGLFLIAVIILKGIAALYPTASEGVIGSLVSLSSSNFIDISLAMIIIFVGFGGILVFFHYQFKKLSDIADEIEKEELKEQ